MRHKKNILKKIYLSFVISAVMSCAVFTQTPAKAISKDADNLAEKIDDYLSRSVALGFSGTALLARNGKIVLKKGYGLADRKRRIAFTPSTIYNLESTTKQFIAAGILKLEEQGKLKTTDLMTKYFENVPEDKKDITLHHLLTHTAGLIGMSGDDFEVIERDAVVRRILDSKLRWVPGTRWAYSNPGYTLLAVVIEKVSGQPHEKFIREQLWIPAGMTDTGYTVSASKRGRLARSYNALEDLGTPFDHPYAPDGPWWNYRGGGGMLSTVEDMYRWHLALKRGTVLSPESQRKAMTPHAVTNNPQTHYGYAWFVSKNPEGKLLVEHGGDGNFMSIFHRYLDEDTVLIVGVNLTYRDRVGSPVRRQVPKILTGGEYKLPPRAILKLPTKEIQDYAGTYELPSGEKAVLDFDGSQLIADTGKLNTAKLFIRLPEQKDEKFMLEASPVAVKLAREIVKENYEPYFEVLFRNVDAEEERGFLKEVWEPQIKRLGAFKDAEPIGTGTANNSQVLYVLLNFEQGSRLVRFHRNGEGRFFMNIDPVPFLAPLYRFVPVSKTEFAGYNFTNNEEVRVDFRKDENGNVSGLTVRGQSGDVFAKKLN